MSKLQQLRAAMGSFGNWYRVGEQARLWQKETVTRIDCVQSPGQLPHATIYCESGCVVEVFNVVLLEYGPEEEKATDGRESS